MASAGRSRPSLLDKAPSPPSSPDFQHSILDALNTPDTPPRRSRGRRAWAPAAVALAGLAATASVLLWAQLQAAPATAEDPIVAQATPTPAATAPRAASAADPGIAASAVPAADAAPAQAARIEDMGSLAAAPAVDASSAVPAAASPFDKLAAAGTAPDATVAPPAAAPIKPADKPTAAKRQEARPQKATPPRSQARAATGPAATRTAKAPPAARGRAAPQAGGADSDVEIMTALMNHMNESAAAHTGGSEASIADLVRHCHSLPAPDAQACQRRICQGYWGRADACPAARERSAAVRTAG